MRFGPVALDAAEGALLAHGQLVGAVRWAKGRVLSAADLGAARAAGLRELAVARLDPGDVAEAEAAMRLGAALAGDNVAALPPVHGRVNLAATALGLVCVAAGAVDRLNAVDEGLTLGTLGPHARVAAGDLVATVKVIPYAVPAAALEAALGVAVPLRVAAFRSVTADLVATMLPGVSAKASAKTDAVTRARLASLGVGVGTSAACAHEASALAALLRAPTAAALTLVIGASATVDRRDVIPAAIVAAGGVVTRVGMPVDPGNLLCLGRIGERAVIGLPGCARSPRRNGFDWVLERLVAGLPVGDAEIAAMGTGGLLPEAERPQPRAARIAPVGPPGPVGALILAAGRSTRMGAAHKLLADLHGRPVVAHTADALIAAGLPPPLVVLGHRATEVRAAFGDRPAIFVTAPDFADGLAASLRAGLAAVPGAWRGVLVCLGDMPRVAPATLRRLAAALTDAAGVAVPVHDGKRGNPVAWGRTYFTRLRALTGDVGGKALLAEVDAVEVPVDDDGVLIDVDTPAALATLLAAPLDRAHA